MSRWDILARVLVLCASATVSTALSEVNPFPRRIDVADLVRSYDAVVINGFSQQAIAGRTHSELGDINGDGFDDLLIGAPGADVSGQVDRGESYVVFGESGGFYSGVVNLRELDGTNGFSVTGAHADDRTGTWVSGIGDVNGDGLHDFVIGSSRADPHDVIGAGAAYVIFGSSDTFPASFSVSSLDGTNGFTVIGVTARAATGHGVSGAGDFNGDGYDDFIVAPYLADPAGRFNAGVVYAIFGKEGSFPAELDPRTLDGTNGFAIVGASDRDQTGFSISEAGDFNGDGIDDIVIGAPGASPNGVETGITYVIFGRDDGFPPFLDLAVMQGSAGVVIEGRDIGGYSGRSVHGAGDINGDGFSDVVIGAPFSSPGGNLNAGKAFVVFGRPGVAPATVQLSSLDGADGFAMSGIEVNDFAGRNVSAAGDVNRDGIDDVFIGARGADDNTGEAYVVFGRTSDWPASLDMSKLDGSDGFVLGGANTGDHFARQVGIAGDVNADGVTDLVVGAPSAHANGVRDAGVTYVILSLAAADAGHSSAFRQNADAGSLLSIEAEHYHANVQKGEHNWARDTSQPGYSGDGTMEAVLSTGTTIAEGYEDTSPRLDYVVEIEQPGTLFVWVRAFATHAGMDSVHVGLDGIGVEGGKRMDFFTPGRYSWSGDRALTGGIRTRAAIEVETAGTHTINVWMREDGFIIDKLVLTTDFDFLPAEKGPAESSRAGDNAIPVLTPIGDKAAIEGETLAFKVLVDDPGDSVELSASALPPGANFVDHGDGTGTFYWATDAGDAVASPYPVTIEATDSVFQSADETISIVVHDADNVDLSALSERGRVSAVTDDWKTVTLHNTYRNPVVVATPVYTSVRKPMLTRVRHAAGTEFELRVQRADGLSDPVAGVDVEYFVVESGVYTDAEFGVNMEAVRFTSTRTDGAGAWIGEPRTLINSYTNPVVLGQVMSQNDPGISVFWSRGVTPVEPPDGTALWVGKHVGADPHPERLDEEIGYLVLEAGLYELGGQRWLAGVSDELVMGAVNGPPVEVPLLGLTAVDGAVASQTAMNGNDGAWVMLAGDSALAQGGLSVSLDEDQLADIERGHGAEQVAFLAFDDAVINARVSMRKDPAPATVDLTADGILDWAHWGLIGRQYTRKLGVPPQVGDVRDVGNGTVRTGSAASTVLSWSDGTPALQASTAAAIRYREAGSGFEFSVEAGVQERELKLYTQVRHARVRYEVTLGRAQDSPLSEVIVIEQPVGDVDDNNVVTINFVSDEEGQLLHVRVVIEDTYGVSWGNVALQGAVLR